MSADHPIAALRPMTRGQHLADDHSPSPTIRAILRIPDCSSHADGDRDNRVRQFRTCEELIVAVMHSHEEDGPHPSAVLPHLCHGQARARATAACSKSWAPTTRSSPRPTPAPCSTPSASPTGSASAPSPARSVAVLIKKYGPNGTHVEQQQDGAREADGAEDGARRRARRCRRQEATRSRRGREGRGRSRRGRSRCRSGSREPRRPKLPKQRRRDDRSVECERGMRLPAARSWSAALRTCHEARNESCGSTS